MRRYDVVWVDAFTTEALTGNACAVLLDARGLDDAAMLAIARETKLSETSFVFPGDGEADFSVRYWTPASEIPMAGHPTIATTHALREAGTLGDRREVRLRMPAGVIPVEIRSGPPPAYAMSQPPPAFLRTYPRAPLAAALGLAERDLAPGYEPQTVSTGTPQLMVALASRDALAQGMHVHRPGRAQVEVGGDPPNAVGRIVVAGSAITVMRATLTI